ncbi:MAG: TolC family protein [Hydrogenophilaceae bacterium]|nr:TolC family protein [Hydrogenophilaceae bacterium]
MKSSGLVLCALAFSISTPVWAAHTLREALDRAWERAAQGRIAESRGIMAEASHTAARSWFPEAPSVEFSHRDDRLNENLGLREREVDLNLPLWLPGQRAAKSNLAKKESAESQAAIADARLSLAGRLRESVWAWAAARTEADLARERLETAQRLEADVARRVKAGDLARTDVLMARDETLAASNALSEARTRERQAQIRYRALTGLEALPDQMEEDVVRLDRPHPREVVAEAAVARARAELLLMRESRRDAPELSIGWQQTREARAQPDSHSLRLGLLFPFATDGHNAPRVAQANAGLIQAEAEGRQVQIEIEAEQQEAEALLENAKAAHSIASERAAAALERLRLLQKAFDLGELALSELMRARGNAGQAKLEAALARTALALSKARVNQSRGALP